MEEGRLERILVGLGVQRDAQAMVARLERMATICHRKGRKLNLWISRSALRQQLRAASYTTPGSDNGYRVSKR